MSWALFWTVLFICWALSSPLLQPVGWWFYRRGMAMCERRDRLYPRWLEHAQMEASRQISEQRIRRDILEYRDWLDE